MEHLYQFSAIVEHKGETKTVKTSAANEIAARNNIVMAEKCPESAIISCESIKQYY